MPIDYGPFANRVPHWSAAYRRLFEQGGGYGGYLNRQAARLRGPNSTAGLLGPVASFQPSVLQQILAARAGGVSPLGGAGVPAAPSAFPSAPGGAPPVGGAPAGPNTGGAFPGAPPVVASPADVAAASTLGRLLNKHGRPNVRY